MTSEIINYYFYAYAGIYCLFIVSMTTSIMSFYRKKYLRINLVLSFLTLVSIFMNGVFLGVLADHLPIGSNVRVWLIQSFIFGGLTLVFFAISTGRAIYEKIKK